VRERESVCVRERESINRYVKSVCVREREKERERERERGYQQIR